MNQLTLTRTCDEIRPPAATAPLRICPTDPRFMMSQLPKRAVMTGLLASFLAASAQTPSGFSSSGHRQHGTRLLAIASPVAGANASSPVTVRYTVNGEDQPVSSKATVYLLVDQLSPPAGTAISADANHVPFPTGQTSVSVPLSAGTHTLQLAAVNSKREVSAHMQVAVPVSITVK